jgi:fatty-acyl-CoA synthase
VLQDEFHARDAIRLVQAERVTVLNGVPMMFHLMMRDASFDRNHLRTLRGGVTAGGSVPTDLVDRVRDWCNVKRSTTVSHPLPGVEVKVVDFVTGVPHGPEAVGEIAARDPNVMLGNARMPAETRRSFTPEGFFLTGDLGIIDEDGYVRIVGRRRDTIMRGGDQIYPREVDDQIRTYPAVDDVCVIGVPHDVMGEPVCACIGPVPDLVRFFDALPTTGSDTVNRRELERMVALDHTAIMGSS